MAGRWIGRMARLAVAAGIVGATGLGVAALHDRAGAAVAPRTMEPLPVRAAPVAQQAGHHETRSFAGRLEPGRAVALGFERGGRVLDVLVDEGDAVAAGAPLARLDTAALLAARDRFAAARAAQAAAVELARLTDARRAGLGELAVSAQGKDEARLARVAAEAELDALDAELAAIDIDLEKSELRAPFAGHVAARSADEGAMLAAGAQVIELIETAAPRARIGLAPDVARALKPGAIYELVHRGARLPARLAALRPDLDTATRTVVALFDIDPAHATGIGFGDVASFEHADWRAEPGYWLPLGALSEGARGVWTVLVVDEGRVQREAVRVVAIDGERVYVAAALPAGARIVLDGAHRVIPGQAVRIAQTGE